jgi:hypothetical protein
MVVVRNKPMALVKITCACYRLVQSSVAVLKKRLTLGRDGDNGSVREPVRIVSLEKKHDAKFSSQKIFDTLFNF